MCQEKKRKSSEQLTNEVENIQNIQYRKLEKRQDSQKPFQATF